MYITIETLWKKHKNKSLIARITGHDWKTVAKKIKEIEQGKKYPQKKPHPRILDSCKEEIFKHLEAGFDDVMAVMSLPLKYRKRLRTINSIERLNEDIRRRERAIRIFPNVESVIRLIGTLLIEQDEK